MPTDIEGAQDAPETHADIVPQGTAPEVQPAEPAQVPASADAEAEPAPEPEPLALTLDEFVTDAVHAGSPMELTNAFHAEERAKAPPRKAALEVWVADLQSFAGRPA